MTLENLIAVIISLSPFLLIKICVLVLLFLYSAFAFILFRQTEGMAKVVEAEISPTIVFLAVFHLLGAVFLFILALFIL